MRSLIAIVKKEVLDNLRDKRALFFSFLYGPVLLPLMMVGPMIFNINKFAIDFDVAKKVHVVGMDRAPNLLEFLATHNLDAVAAPENYEDQLKEGGVSSVLEVPENYSENFRDARPATLFIHYDQDNDESDKLKRQLQTVLDQYSGKIRSLRLRIRGMDENIFKPLNVVELNIADPKSKTKMVGYILPFLLMFSMMLGGFYLAVDTTAGERERLSLEPLLSLPVSRFTLVSGKYLALLCFVLIAGSLPLITSYVIVQFIPLDVIGGMFDFSIRTFALAAILVLPLALLVAGFLLALGSFAQNTKEAQTHLGMANFAAMIPFFVLQFLNVDTNWITISAPILGQYQIMGLVVSGDQVPNLYFLQSTLGTVAVAAAFYLAALWLYTREKILM